MQTTQPFEAFHVHLPTYMAFLLIISHMSRGGGFGCLPKLSVLVSRLGCHDGGTGIVKRWASWEVI